MSNGNPRGNSAWPLIAIVAVIVAVAVAGWDAMLQKRIKTAEDRIKKTEQRLEVMETKATAAEAAAARARRRARAAEAAGGEPAGKKNPAKSK